jgi:hypothetical protein
MARGALGSKNRTLNLFARRLIHCAPLSELPKLPFCLG